MLTSSFILSATNTFAEWEQPKYHVDILLLTHLMMLHKMAFRTLLSPVKNICVQQLINRTCQLQNALPQFYKWVSIPKYCKENKRNLKCSYSSTCTKTLTSHRQRFRNTGEFISTTWSQEHCTSMYRNQTRSVMDFSRWGWVVWHFWFWNLSLENVLP